MRQFVLLELLDHLQLRDLHAVEAGDDSREELGRLGGQFSRAALQGFPEGSGQFTRRRIGIADVGAHAGAEIGRREVVFSGQQHARHALGARQNVLRDVSERIHLGRGPEIEIASGEILYGRYRVPADGLPGLQNMFDSHHVHIVLGKTGPDGESIMGRSMHQKLNERIADPDPVETAEWVAALEQVIDEAGPGRATYLLDRLEDRARRSGAGLPAHLNTPYVNTIRLEDEVPYPGDRALERRIKSLIRWNAMAMVVRQNKYDPGIGGHISTYASLATLLEVGFNHFFHAAYGDQPGDLIYFQGHASPGVYSRAFLEGRLTERHLQNFRHELRDEPGLSSYPHPWLMPDFWRFPTVSMGLGPLNAIYQARFMRYLENRGAIPATPRKIWAFLGDGEMDEPESMGSLTLASREKLDNLIFVVNCNLQRLDGPVRGNGKVIQELEAAFRGAGWNVLKVIWGGDWDELLAPRHHRAAAKAHGRSGGWRVPDLHQQGRRLHPQEFLWPLPRTAGPGGPPERRRTHASSVAAGTIRARSITSTRRAVETVGQPTLDPGPHHQGLRPG